MYFNLDDIQGLKEHNHRVGILAHKLSKQCNFEDEDCSEIRIAGKLHDIGKYYIPHDIINKPNMLSNLEYEVMKHHPIYSSNILKEHHFNQNICDMVYYHHENYDGSGYPDGLKGKLIPIGARILKICDVYDALTNNRVYRDRYSKYEALQIMVNEKSKYDPEILPIFLFMIKK